jgi:hypothetical protein
LLLLIGLVVAGAALYEDEAKIFVMPLVLITMGVNISAALVDIKERRRLAFT